MMYSFDLVQTIPAGNALGEGILWRPSDQTIWWTDIIGRVLCCLPWGHSRPVTWDMPQRLCAFGFIRGNDTRLVAAFETGFAYLDLKSGNVEWRVQPPELKLGSGRRLNDGRVGPDGAFWVGAMLERDDVPGGTNMTRLYRFDGQLAEPLHSGLHISNGLTWSPCGETIYLADSAESTIFKAPFNRQTGQLGKFSVFSVIKSGDPDGAVTDAQGNYWSAIWGGASVMGVNKNGATFASLALPVPQPTIPAFGGPNLDHMIVASAYDGLSHGEREAHPESGNVFVFSTNIKGLPPHRFIEK